MNSNIRNKPTKQIGEKRGLARKINVYQPKNVNPSKCKITTYYNNLNLTNFY